TTATAAGLVAPAPAPDLGAAWRGLLFNSFHDILPGSSIERALDEQTDWTRGLLHTARTVEFSALNALARRADTTVPAVGPDHPSAMSLLVWNPHPHAYAGPLELEVCLDYRPIFAYENRPGEVPLEVRGPGGQRLPFQRIKPEHSFLPAIPWRIRVLTTARLPALGWGLFSVGWVEGARAPAVPAGTRAPRRGEITNGRYRVAARPGARGISLFQGARRLLAAGGLGAITVDDAFGSWGGLYDEPDSLHLMTVRHAWKVTAVETLESGPLRAALWVRLTGGSSQLDLCLRLARGRDAIDVEARLLWNETRARLKLVFPGAGDQATTRCPAARCGAGPRARCPADAGSGCSGTGTRWALPATRSTASTPRTAPSGPPSCAPPATASTCATRRPRPSRCPSPTAASTASTFSSPPAAGSCRASPPSSSSRPSPWPCRPTPARWAAPAASPPSPPRA
ncbi:MAG: hypothetical protein NT173_00400, partial [Opitutales bacterium]|nr:hypothetical protein [Opitutales bacterium]